jgi:DNA-binding response OmpR family regulator
VDKVKILVVDNDESLLNLLRLYLEAEGYEPLLARYVARAWLLTSSTHWILHNQPGKEYGLWVDSN